MEGWSRWLETEAACSGGDIWLVVSGGGGERVGGGMLRGWGED